MWYSHSVSRDERSQYGRAGTLGASEDTVEGVPPRDSMGWKEKGEPSRWGGGVG